MKLKIDPKLFSIQSHLNLRWFLGLQGHFPFLS